MTFRLAAIALVALLHMSPVAATSREAQLIESTLGRHRERDTRSAEPDGRHAAVKRAYERRGFEPIWFEHGQLQPSAQAILEELDQAEYRGLHKEDYAASELRRRLNNLRNASDLQERAGLDIALTVALTRLVSDLLIGRVTPAKVGYDLDVPRSSVDMSTLIERLASVPRPAEELDRIEPQLRHYALLKNALRQYRALARSGERTLFPALPRRSVRAGESYEGVNSLRDFLTLVGDLPTSTNGAVTGTRILDEPLKVALARFQTRHGLEPDGVLGPLTFRELSTPLAARVTQIELSLERIRWLPRQLDSAPIVVNIPQFRMFAFRTTHDYASEILQMDVIVGSTFEGSQTPVFAADMRYVVLNPYWDVPAGIAVREFLPQIMAGPDWLERNHYEIVTGQGDEAQPMQVPAHGLGPLLERGTARLRQAPGPWNALGRVKFIFPNRHDVYFHDTPARSLFTRSRRAFSHGCIRVSDPAALLAHVLRDDPSWTQERLEAALSSQKSVRIALKAPLRVFIVYATALATEAGDMLFFEDIYGHDARLEAALGERN